MGLCVNVAHGFVMARLDVVLLGNAVSVGGAEPTLDPIVLECRFELFDATVKSFLLFGGEGWCGQRWSHRICCVLQWREGCI